MADRVRATSFRLPPEYFGHVYAYRAGPRFDSAWRRIEEAKKLLRPQQLPHAGLETALRVVSGDLVRLRRWVNDRDPHFIISRKPIALKTLANALFAWEHAIWPNGANGFLADVADDLREERLDVDAHIHRRPGRCPEAAGWVWEVAVWEVAHRLRQAPMDIGQGVINWRLDSEGELVTWDQPIVVERNGRQFGAMHRLKPRLITVPGFNDPVIHLDASVSRLACERIGPAKFAWVDRGNGGLLLLGRIKHRRMNGDYTSIWDDLASEVLDGLALTPLPDLMMIDWRQIGPVRARRKSAPQGWPIGKGPGQIFHEAVGLHAYKHLVGSSPVEFSKARPSLETGDRMELNADSLQIGIDESGTDLLRIVCVYALDEIRKRLAEVLTPLLGKRSLGKTPLLNNKPLTSRKLQVLFTAPTEARRFLIDGAAESEVQKWASKLITNLPSAEKARTVILAEVGARRTFDDEMQDPKHVLRRTFAKHGIASQFITADSCPQANGEDDEQDFGAERAVWDLLRSAGAFVRAFPSVEAEGPGPLLVGVTAVKRHDRSKVDSVSLQSGDGYVVSLVAAEAGTRRAFGFDRKRGWQPLGDATPGFLTEDHNMNVEHARRMLEDAIKRLLVNQPSRRFIVFFDSPACRSLVFGLSDTGDGLLPAYLRSERVAVVRVRSDSNQVPRPAGLGPWQNQPTFTGTMHALLRLENAQWDGVGFYISTPPMLGRPGPHRFGHTRHHARAADQKRDWHSLNLTEFRCLQPGPFQSEDLCELSARLCRQAPTWEGTLNAPSPIHLAKALVRDHPQGFLSGDEVDGDSDA